MSKLEKATQALRHPYAALALVILSDFFFTFMDATAQHLEIEFDLPIGQVVLLRITGTLIICLIYLYRTSNIPLITLLTPGSPVPWIRSVVLTVGSLSAYASVKYVALSEFMTIFHIRPIPVALMCFIFLGEAFTRVQMAACATVISFGAVLFVFQPPFLFGAGDDVPVTTPGRILGFVFAATCMLAGAGDVVLCRKMGESIDVVVLLTMYTIAGLVTCPIWIFFDPAPIVWNIPLQAWMEIAFLSTMGCLAQLTVTFALKTESGGRVALIGYFQVIIAVVVQYLFVGTTANVFGFLGMGIIMAAGIWAAVWGKPTVDPLPKEDYQALLTDDSVELGLQTSSEPLRIPHKAVEAERM